MLNLLIDVANAEGGGDHGKRLRSTLESACSAATTVEAPSACMPKWGSKRARGGKVWARHEPSAERPTGGLGGATSTYDPARSETEANGQPCKRRRSWLSAAIEPRAASLDADALAAVLHSAATHSHDVAGCGANLPRAPSPSIASTDTGKTTWPARMDAAAPPSIMATSADTCSNTTASATHPFQAPAGSAGLDLDSRSDAGDAHRPQGLALSDAERVAAVMSRTASVGAHEGIPAQEPNSKVRANARRLEGNCAGCGCCPEHPRSGSATRRNARDEASRVYYGLPWCNSCYGLWARAYGNPNKRKEAAGR